MSFAKQLRTSGLALNRGETACLQVNLGLKCNQYCKHCHLDAGPDRDEFMDQETVDQVIAYAKRGGFDTVDITGGAPELNPHLRRLIKGVRPLVGRVMLRANLTALLDAENDGLMDFLAENRVVVVSSFPAVNAFQTNSQRGRGVFERSIECLQKLNELGYGRSGSGLELNLVSNPVGAFLPPEQGQAEERFRDQLQQKWGISFNQLFTFANVPLGRFEGWLRSSGNYEAYLDKLISSFNPCALDGVMCRNQVSVAWDGYLYDCDFNLAAGLPLGGVGVHVSEMEAAPRPGSPVAVGDHCYTCTAGAGFT